MDVIYTGVQHMIMILTETSMLILLPVHRLCIRTSLYAQQGTLHLILNDFASLKARGLSKLKAAGTGKHTPTLHTAASLRQLLDSILATNATLCVF